MKNLCTLLLLLLICACGDVTNKDSERTTVVTKPISQNMDTLLRHVVLFKFNEKATQDIVQEIEQAFVSLSDKIDDIHSLEWGINNSPEGLDKGLTHCFFLSFESEAARSRYLPHPDHLAFVDLISPYVEDVTVVDYWQK